jgi:ABC-type sugar transport system permease subunit
MAAQPMGTPRHLHSPASFRRWREYRVGLLFLLPAFLLYASFEVYPFFQSIYLSLTSWDGATADKPFVGLANYATILHDPVVWTSLEHNLIWVVVGTIAPLVVGLLLAMLLWTRPRGFLLFRTVFFMPQVLPAIIIGIIWQWIYNPYFGPLTPILDRLGLGALNLDWLGDPSVALYAVLVAAIWAQIGFVFVVVFAGLQNVNVELLEAAMIDGANAWHRFWYVTLPELSNVLTTVTALMLIGGFSVFDLVFIMTGGGPNNSTQLIATYAYQQAFQQNQVGYAAALSLVLTGISLVASVVFIRLRERGDS